MKTTCLQCVWSCGSMELRETNHCTVEKTGVTQKRVRSQEGVHDQVTEAGPLAAEGFTTPCQDEGTDTWGGTQLKCYRRRPRMQALTGEAFTGGRKSQMNGISLHKNELGENEMINQKLVSRSFFYILKACYQTAWNPSSLGTGRRPVKAACCLLEAKALHPNKDILRRK